jgi:NADPH:quinone reductase
MRAYAIQGLGAVPAVIDLPRPAADGAFLIRVMSAGVNPVDLLNMDRLTANSSFPFVLGWDYAGVLEQVPAGERDFHVGDRIFGEARAHGSFAEYTSVAPGVKLEPMARIPDGVTDDQAAALPVPATTAFGALDLLGLTAGQRLVVMGATGGVGGFAVQMARARGALVTATVRGNVDEARQLGADEVFDTRSGDIVAAVRASHPEGVDAVLDLVNDAGTIGRDAELLKSGGALVSSRHAADPAWFAERHITAHNIATPTNPLTSPEGLTRLVALLAKGTISARIRSTVPLEQAGQVLDALRHGGLNGKAVIHMS